MVEDPRKKMNNEVNVRLLIPLNLPLPTEVEAPELDYPMHRYPSKGPIRSLNLTSVGRVSTPSSRSTALSYCPRGVPSYRAARASERAAKRHASPVLGSSP